MFRRDKIEKIEIKQFVGIVFALILLVLLCLFVYCTWQGADLFASNATNDEINYGAQLQSRRRRQFREGEWTFWTSWTPCIEYPDLKAYVQTRERTCNGGLDCGGGEPTQARACLPNGPSSLPSTTTAEWQPWSAWSDCSVDPALTTAPFRTRWRECDRSHCIDNANCAPCTGNTYEQTVCANDVDVPYRDINSPLSSDQKPNCQWTPWSVWSTCSATCGRTARSYRARSCSCTIRRGCPGSPIEDRLCEGLPPCGNFDADTFRLLYNSVSPVSAVQPQQDPSNNNLGYPCNMCPPRYPFPCYTCINLRDPRGP